MVTITKIRQVEFAGSLADQSGTPPKELPEVAFSGRSNVGKSSLINTLLGRTRSKLARVSATPGKTQLLNFFEVNGAFYLLDLPGFGFAKVPHSVKEGWRELIEGYLAGSPRLKGVVHLVDARHPPTKLDHQMMAYLETTGIPALVVLTKMDKLKRSERQGAIARAGRELEIDEEQIVPFSSKTGEGREALLEAIGGIVGVQ